MNTDPAARPAPAAPPIISAPVFDDSGRGRAPFAPSSVIEAPAPVDPSVSRNQPTLRRLPSTSKVVPASRLEAPGSTNRVNQADFQPTVRP